MPSGGMSFEQLEAYFSEIDAGSPASSAESTWLQGAAEAQELAAELTRNVAQLKEYWTGPAANEYYAAMQAIIDLANGLASDMSNMATGLSQMAASAASIQPEALSIIAAARPHHWSRAAAIAPLTGLLNQLGGQYLSNKSQYWKDATEPSKQLPQAGGEQDSTPVTGDPGKDVSKSPILGTIDEIGKYIGLADQAWRAYQAFDADSFPSGVVGDFPSGGGDFPVGGGGGDVSGPGDRPGGGAYPAPDDPDYQPLPEPQQDMTESPVNLAGAGPAGIPNNPAVSLAVNNGAAMSSPGGAGGPMPMGMGMGAMGAAANSARSAPSGASGSRGGLFGAPMGGARRAPAKQDSEGVRTWLTEDELAWDSEPAPGGIVGR